MLYSPASRLRESSDEADTLVLDTRRAPGGVHSGEPGPPEPAGSGDGDGDRSRGLLKLLSLLGVAVICGLIAWHVGVKILFIRGNLIMAGYTILISSYVLSRFGLAAFYRPPADRGIEPTVAIIVPAYNESEAVSRTIHSCLALDYPRDKIEIVVINDGSSDDTWERMQEAAAQYPPGAVRCIDLGRNMGKRAAMAAGIRATSSEILVFVDSDSMPAQDAITKLVQGFADEKVGAISGLTYVRNADTNSLTRMQATRYYVSFQLLKSAESVLGAVTCCSGCFAAYRRSAVVDLLDEWEHQRFLGVECTYGDDRALTNRVIKAGWTTRYDSRAEAWTDAPDDYRKFFRQQLRWKKSWSREGPLLLAHIWRSRLRALPSVAVQTVAGLMSPLVILYSLAQPLTHGRFPAVYFVGLFLVSCAYALVYRMLRNDGMWIYAFLGTFFYIAFSPQLLWALARIRDGKWGTRDDAGTGQSPPAPRSEAADRTMAQPCLAA
ncbi:glycosyltransferase family 2 protein [Amorphoplanes nipponensis]|uniref:Chitin synthase n=1 Tax=Actinoplanes nipponensis TaxID=135950 RepID=A0A919MLK7_9ACTN|nr:glycosyltransferase [Actinoplanes nipponensis]GIE49611.1 chitin synthase [Actinoplanes nipponensis]